MRKTTIQCQAHSNRKANNPIHLEEGWCRTVTPRTSRPFAMLNSRKKHTGKKWFKAALLAKADSEGPTLPQTFTNLFPPIQSPSSCRLPSAVTLHVQTITTAAGDQNGQAVVP